MSRRPARCTEAEIRRAVKIAAKAEKPMAVELRPDGTICIVPATPKPVGESAGGTDQKGGIVL